MICVAWRSKLYRTISPNQIRNDPSIYLAGLGTQDDRGMVFFLFPPELALSYHYELHMDKKEKRQQAIKKLITAQPIEDQQELVQKLQELYGIETNQSIVSRDLRTLNIGKRDVQGRLIYETSNQDVRRDIMRSAILDVQHNETMLIVKTLPGLADFTAEYIDQQELDDVLGTLAGENTVFIVPRSIKTITTAYKNLCKALYFKPPKETE